MQTHPIAKLLACIFGGVGFFSIVVGSSAGDSGLVVLGFVQFTSALSLANWPDDSQNE